MNDYMNYIKCGEILRSPTIGKDQYILKCLKCEDQYFLLDQSFVFPCAGHIKLNEGIITTYDELLNDIKSDDNECDEHHGDATDVTIKFEYITNTDECDPLNLVKTNITADGEIENLKEDSILQESIECVYHMDEVKDGALEEENVHNYSDKIHWENIQSDNESMESNDSNSTTFIQNFMKSQQSVTVFITAYKNQPNLWNQKSSQIEFRDQNKKYLDKVRKELKEKLNLHISCKEVATIITFLCRKYREHLHILTSNGNNQPEWFFEQLEFLKPYMIKGPNEKIKSGQCDLVPEQTIKLLTIYQRFPHLWNSNLIENCCFNKRHEALQQMVNVVNSEMSININENNLKKYIHFLHALFTKEKRRQMKNKDTTTNGDKYEYDKYMMFLNDHIGPFKCSECGIELRNPLYFKVHQSQHDNSIPLKCSMCNKEFKILRTYMLHARRHMDDLAEVCKECGKKFINASELKIHMRFHTGAKPYCCEVCGISFRHIQTFASHKRRHDKKYLHNCSICSKGFYSKAKMDDHIRSHKQIREFVCKTCGKAFITKKTLKQHEVTHGDLRKYVCTLCGKDFKLKVGVTQHMKTHGSQIYERPNDF